MAALQRWRAWLIMVVALVLMSACASGGSTHAISGATATTGPVTITTNLPAYTTGDAIGVIVTNTAKSDFFAQNGRSACTVVQLEQYDSTSGKWLPLDNCGGGTQAQAFALAQGVAVPYTLAPNSPTDQNAWQPGTYRVSITYSAQADGVSNPQEAHTAAFKVTA